jgi:phosphorylase kinase alpha/beta subunit
MARASGRDKLIAKHLKILAGLQYESGLFAASKKGKGEGYDKAWLRDNFYECLAFEALGDYDTVWRTYRAILDIFKKHEYKIDFAVERKPEHTHQYIHARYHPETFDEYWEEWGNKQNDAVGCILFKLGELEELKSGFIVQDDDDRAVVQKLVQYLETLEYWHDDDSGMWEEDKEVHASSVGACVAGLKKARGIEGMSVSDELVQKGEEALMRLLPRESETKTVDLALLSLIWPYEVTTPEQTRQILTNVEHHLLRERGVIRYEGDKYFYENPKGGVGEAEWTFGLSWLAIIYAKLGEKKEARKYLEKAKAAVTRKGLPELYFAGSDTHNENTPLGWSESLFLVALHELEV